MAIAMTVATFASILALISSVYFSTMVHRADVEAHRAYLGITTMRIMPSGMRNGQWTTYLPYGSKIEDVLGLMVNDTRNLAEALPGRRYTPRKFGYEVACDSISVAVRPNSSDILPQEVGGCSAVLFSIGSYFFDWDPETAINIRTGPNQYTIVATVKFEERIALFEPQAPSVFFYEYVCAVSPSISGDNVRNFRRFPDSGMTSLPRTSLYKCQYPSGALNVVAQTRMNFAIRGLAEYDNITTTIFDDSRQLPLLATMGAFAKNGTFSRPKINSTMVALTMASTNVHFFRCHSVRSADFEVIGLLCSYIVLEAIMTKPQPEDPTIAADLTGRPVLAANESVNQNAVWVDHFNMNIASSIPTFSVSSLLNATLSGAQYFASLGQNFVMDWEKGQLYVLFDTVDIKDGQEFSTGLFAALVVVMVLCAGLWAFTERTLKGIYTGSLYKLAYTRSKPRMEKPAPMLMSCAHDPLAFERVPIDEILVDPSLQELASISAARLLPDAVTI
ncbi:hypothetical protein BGZ75_006458 [Mortierella antarctica]|nr:hypothetical protein BGZ75_006458 [Mortierella antarctica]